MEDLHVENVFPQSLENWSDGNLIFATTPFDRKSWEPSYRNQVVASRIDHDEHAQEILSMSIMIEENNQHWILK